jgi:hypothetical protein
MGAGDIYGDSNVGGIILCTVTSGAAGSEVPDTANGETVYMIFKAGGIDDRFLQKIKEIAAGVCTASRDGKRGCSINCTGGIVVKWTGGVASATNTAGFNLVRQWILGKHDAGDAPFYLFMYNFVDTTYVKLGYGTNYLKGYLSDFSTELKEGNVYYVKNLTFKWVSV